MVSPIIHRTSKFFQDNSPLVLTAIGVTGTLTTAYLTGKATFKAAELMRDVLEEESHYPEARAELEFKDAFAITWKLYLPAASSGILTIACIIGANRIGTRRAAAMASAYAISERAFTEYREKIVEKLGEKKERAVRDEIAQDRIAKNPPSKEVVIAGSNDVLCFDMFSGRYFRSTMENIKKAMNDINFQILQDNDASLGDFYDKVGLPGTSQSEELGWNTDKLLDLVFSTVLTDDQQPAIAIDFNVKPIRNYYKVW